ncbi:MAG: endopeptidase La [Bacteroidetes Order II. Incertae sedis bacterium]|jgi:ATP-dependent Lon protease|nr:endopeptidase La [Bacteroidetes Order II. bacterium]MBT6200262.1 endopeptidase La [Bacteroidetes Order II. bacterium]MBT6424309.1 endopeptidase La [Bacteroidetes Order II. bacterium]MBT6599827.1 endopeptidase La [Bacteroidetes Order II. bacterium]
MLSDLVYLLDDDPEQSIPLPTADEEKEMSLADVPAVLPILTLRNTVLFPGVVLPITVGRDTSLKLVKDAFGDDRLIGVVAQKRSETENPSPSDLYEYGTVASILKLIKMPDGSKSIVIQGKRRFRISEFVQTEPYFTAKVEPVVEDLVGEDIEIQARIRSIKELAIQIVNLSPNLPSEAAYAIQNIDSPTFLIHFIASNLQIEVADKQTLLETLPLVERADLVMNHLNQELQVLQLSEEIRSRVKTDVDQQQREYLLRQQMKAIQDELGETEGGGNDVIELRQRADKKRLPEEVREVLKKELDKLARSNPASPDYAVTRNYVDWILDTPWMDYSEDQLNIPRAGEILNEDHYGLEAVKQRILEYLAVLKLKGDMKAPILCFHGPPGVGKTSLGKSIARALGREFVRMSLGGVRDEAEIRGHRRTYVGALPGRIIQGMKKAGTANPVFMLDEVDKLGSDFRGDPSSALLEVLDPEQNIAFNDHYLEVDYDLSNVLFIATANYLEMIPAPLRDRMEMIEINGYTQEEKLAIARQYLVPRQVERNGLKKKQFSLTSPALKLIIDGYTRESGVRQLERTIGSVARGVAKKVAMEESTGEKVEADHIEDYLKARKYFSDVAERTEVPGVATGLAWTPVGGDILFIEASVSRGSGRMVLTGQLGDVMKESAQAALSYVKAQAQDWGIPQDAFKHWDLHVHVPAGGIPKDGPSAGVSMLSALISIYTQRRVRHNVAMTGEITLRGLVLPVGGIKEKVLAAKRAGIKSVILPDKNRKDVEEIAASSLRGLSISYVKRMSEVIDLALLKRPINNPATFFAVPDKERPVSTNGEEKTVHA